MAAAIAVHCHGCDQKLGVFAPADDHGSVVMVCPACRQPNEIFNAAMLEVLDNPDDYEPNDRITASEAGLDEDFDEDDSEETGTKIDSREGIEEP